MRYYPRQVITAGHWLGVFVIGAVLVTGCAFTPPAPQVTPTLIPDTNTPTATSTPPPTVTLSAVPTTPAPESLVQPSNTPLPPTSTPLPTSTPGPFQHELQEGETLGYIVQLYGHRSFDVIPEVVSINEEILNADTLPGAGTTILVPRPTQIIPTDDPNSDDNGDSAPAVADANTVPNDDISGPTNVHQVIEGQTIIDIAQIHSTTLEVLSQLNPELNFFGCNFNVLSGGPNCSVPLQIGQEITVPAPTPTPTLSPTPSGNETATPTPPYDAPVYVFPPDGGIARPGRIELQWVSVGALEPDEAYIVQVKDITADTDVVAFVTRSNTYELPADLIPTDGQTHRFQWWVSVGKRNDRGVYDIISRNAPVSTFEWQSAN